MNKLLSAAVIASAFAVATPAMAVSTFSYDITALLTPTANGATGDFGNTPLRNGEPLVSGKFAFQDTITFTYSPAATVSGGVIQFRVGSGTALQDIDFDSITFNGGAGTVTNSGGISTASFMDVDFAAGLQTIVLNGRSTGGASYGGSLEIINGAVPEPTTWALMILGFGMVGASMRSRRRSVVAA